MAGNKIRLKREECLKQKKNSTKKTKKKSWVTKKFVLFRINWDKFLRDIANLYFEISFKN